jgi:hypothetical protein
LNRIFDIDTRLDSRSISFENSTGERGAGGRAASPLGVGRKGAPARVFEPDETVELCDIKGPGIIRHLWMTTRQRVDVMRGMVVRAYWEGQSHPSIECPLGDFFGFAHGYTPAFESEVHSVGTRYGLNVWLPMPFLRRARFTLSNELPYTVPIYYQIDYTLHDALTEAAGRLHVSFRRENSTTLAKDFALMPPRSGGPGRFVGAVIGVRPRDPRWWGEGEVKFYLDDDQEFATIVGTGSEDYACVSFGIQQTPFRYHGANWRENDHSENTGRVSMYRWHIVDPIYWKSAIRAEIQQIGISGGGSQTVTEYLAKFYERSDDWSSAAFWYEPTPSQPLPPLADLGRRIADLPCLEPPKS